ncbi:hypothetical protein [Kitasatospora sp. NPDC094011]|uniref:hypothetical protein n=1 Tax=Kitasatospora sp. NPDC094011 TaxID=3364090 RepID=UPI003830532A
MRVVLAGQGYVGLPLAVRAAQRGHRVLGYGVHQHRVSRLTAGESFVQDVPSARLRAVLESGAYRATADPAELAGGYDLAVITVPTPLRNGRPDLSCVESCARADVCGADPRNGTAGLDQHPQTWQDTHPAAPNVTRVTPGGRADGKTAAGPVRAGKGVNRHGPRARPLRDLGHRSG